MPLEQAERDELITSITKSITDNLSGVFAEQINGLTNKYDKALDKKVQKMTEPLLADIAKKASKKSDDGNGSDKKVGDKKMARMLLKRGVPIEKLTELGLDPGKKFVKKLGLGDKKDTADNSSSGTGTGTGKQFKDPLAKLGKKKFNALRERVAELEKQTQEKEHALVEAQIDSEVSQMLSGFEWAKPSSLKIAFKEIRPRIQRDQESGVLHVDGNDAEKYIKALVPEEYDYLLAPVDKNGAGAQRSHAKQKGVDLDDIAGKSKEETDKIARETARLLGA